MNISSIKYKLHISTLDTSRFSREIEINKLSEPNFF